MMNNHVHTPGDAPDATMSPAKPASALPVTLAGQAASELAFLLNEYGNGEYVAVVFPSDRHEYPIHFIVSKEHNESLRCLYRYREACRALAEGGGKGLRARQSARDQAHHDLMASFFEVRT